MQAGSGGRIRSPCRPQQQLRPATPHPPTWASSRRGAAGSEVAAALPSSALLFRAAHQPHCTEGEGGARHSGLPPCATGRRRRRERRRLAAAHFQKCWSAWGCQQPCRSLLTTPRHHSRPPHLEQGNRAAVHLRQGAGGATGPAALLHGWQLALPGRSGRLELAQGKPGASVSMHRSQVLRGREEGGNAGFQPPKAPCRRPSSPSPLAVYSVGASA